MDILIFMVGENVHGRIMSNALYDRGIEHTCIIEKKTEKSLIAEKWLDPDYGSQIRSPIVYTNDIFGTASKNKLSNFHGYAINGGAIPILKKDILMLPSMGFLNAHPGLLPNYRGLDPVKWAIADIAPIGATVHKMDEGIDTGPILLKKELKTFNSKTIRGLRLEVMELCGELLSKYLINPELYPERPQNKEEGTTYSAYLDGDEEEAEKKLKPLLDLYPLSSIETAEIPKF